MVVVETGIAPRANQDEISNAAAHWRCPVRVWSKRIPICTVFDFAVIDMGLPDRPGDHLTAEPIIVGSGCGESEVRHRFEADERFAFLNEPYERTCLRASIDSLSLADPKA